MGKTTLFWRYVNNESLPDQPSTTIDFRYKNINLHDKEVRLCIWDTAGQEKFRSIVATYFKSCEGVILIFDQSDPLSWNNIRDVWHDLAFKRASNATYLLLGNKSDLPCLVDLSEVNKWCKERGVYFIQTCALSGENITQAFFTLSALIDSKRESCVNSSFSTLPVTGASFSTQPGSDNRRITSRPMENSDFRSAAPSFCLKREKEKPRKKKECCH